jgi:hypothetical protein
MNIVSKLKAHLNAAILVYELYRVGLKEDKNIKQKQIKQCIVYLRLHLSVLVTYMLNGPGVFSCPCIQKII